MCISPVVSVRHCFHGVIHYLWLLILSVSSSSTLSLVGEEGKPEILGNMWSPQSSLEGLVHRWGGAPLLWQS